MNVLIISTFDTKGGAARAAYRLYQGLKHIGVNAAMLVKEKYSQEPDIFQAKVIADDKTQETLKTIQTIQEEYNITKRTEISNTLFSSGYPGFHIADLEIVRWADIINLHWTAKFQSTESIAALLALGKPVVWTLHDQNPFTGGCHYSAGCLQYKEDCRSCPQLTGDSWQLPHFSLQNKEHYLRGSGITVVSPSRWLANEARCSRVFQDASVVTIPNSIDILTFTPQSKIEAKQKLDIPAGTLTILTGVSGWRPKRKGLSEFLEAMRHCLENHRFKRLVLEGKILLLCFGHRPAEEFAALSIPFKSFNHVDSDDRLCHIYSAADLFVLPSVEDNLPNTMVESMACETPVVAFNIGGMPDMIDDRMTGRLVPFRNTKAMAEAVIELIEQPRERLTMGKNARQLIERAFKPEDQAHAYARLFYQLLPGEHGKNASLHLPPRQNIDCPLNFSFHQFFNDLKKELKSR